MLAHAFGELDRCLLRVGLAVRGEVWHLIVTEVEIPAPYFIEPAAVSAADIAQEPVIIGPFRDG